MPDLSAADRRRAHRAGPWAVAVRTSYESMLRNAGFEDIRKADRTAEYRVTQASWIAAVGKRETDFRRIMGDAAYEERLLERQGTLVAIDSGVLGRFLYWANLP